MTAEARGLVGDRARGNPPDRVRGLDHPGRRLAGAGDVLRSFVQEVSSLGSRLGPILVQLPPTLLFEGRRVRPFLEALRRRHGGGVVLEPRHVSWFAPVAGELPSRLRLARVAADPAPVPEASTPGGWPRLVYYRLHGSPRRYYSAYGEAFLRSLAAALAAHAERAETWCVSTTRRRAPPLRMP